MKLPNFLQRLSAALSPLEHETPGESGRRRAAVLVLFYPRGKRITFVLTVRPDTLSRHPGQISLPGGMAEPYDATLWTRPCERPRKSWGYRRDVSSRWGAWT